MRNLTIKREKSFVGCLGKMKVFIEDPIAHETFINDVPCRKLGTLKNGEEKTFVIGDEQARVIVAGDMLAKNLSNDYCTIPAGIEPVYLKGKNHYNPGAGNPFLFDGVTDEAVLKKRKKMGKIGWLILVVAFIVGLGIGFLNEYNSADNAIDGEPVNIIDDSGVKMKLTDSFEETELDGFTFAYASEDVVVFGVNESFSLMEGFEKYSPEEYGELVIENNGVDAQLQNENGVIFFEYEFYNSEVDVNYSYFVAVYKSFDSFWTVNFAVAEEDYEIYRPLFLEWAESVMFVDNEA